MDKASQMTANLRKPRTVSPVKIKAHTVPYTEHLTHCICRTCTYFKMFATEKVCTPLSKLVAGGRNVHKKFYKGHCYTDITEQDTDNKSMNFRNHVNEKAAL